MTAMSSGRELNRPILRVFAPVLVLAGLAGFVVPERRSPTSGALAYNVFHIVFGTIGVCCARSLRRRPARLFNLAFGGFDLYQAVANRRGWFPHRWFRWKTGDDVLHVVIGAVLVGAALSDRAGDDLIH
jgi:hypothetical protein